MQRLVWQNSNGDEINLTSGNYGITEWEGFSNASLNIQSQQVPFQDGGVFLDALIEQRELSVTLAMNDGGNLEERYRMRRELVHALNPKLGEGYLIYTNDFISKRIKCVPQIPLFETHNSNDSGTPKASLAWTACEPYWEDLEEKEMTFNITQQPIINNNGDVPCQMQIDWFTNGVTNGKLTNVTKNQFIKYQGELTKNLKIDTEIGNKSVTTQEMWFLCNGINNIIYSIRYFEEIDLIIGVGYGGIILKSKNGDDWEYSITGLHSYSEFLMDIAYSSTLGMFVMIGYYSNDGIILSSQDGINWTSRESENLPRLKSIIFSNQLDKFIAVGEAGTILTSADGIIWESQTSGVSANLNKIIYCDDLDIYVIVGDSGTILISSDCINWITKTSGVNVNLNGIIFNSDLDIIITVGDSGNIVTSDDGNNWTHKTIDSRNIRDINYNSKNKIYVIVGNIGVIKYSYDGVSWVNISNSVFSNSPDLLNILYVNKLDSYFISGDIFVKSQGLNNWENCFNKINGDAINGIAYNKDLDMFVAIGKSMKVIKSYNGINWTISCEQYFNLNDIIYVAEKKLFFAVGDSGKIVTSNDGNNWESQTSGVNVKLNAIIYVPTLELFVAIGDSGTILTSADGFNWNNQTIGNFQLKGIAYSDLINLFVIVGGGSYTITSNDGINWTINNLLNASSKNSIVYNHDLNIFVAVGDYSSSFKKNIAISSDGVNWQYYDPEELNNKDLYKIKYIKELSTFIAVGEEGIIITSINGIVWKKYGLEKTFNLYGVSYSNKKNIFSIGGFRCYLLNSEITYEENEIQNLSTDSDLNMNLDIGKNQFKINYDSGNMNVRIKYRQKYIGV